MEAEKPADHLEGPARPVPRWGLGDFAFGLVAGLSLSSLAASGWLAATGDSELNLLGQSLSQIGLWTGMVMAVVWASHRKGAGRVAEDFGFRARWADLAVGVAMGLAVQLLVLPGLAFALRPVLGRPEVSGPARQLLDRAQGGAFIGLVLSVGVGAPLVEELFFRGLFLRSLQKRMPDAAAVAISAAAFGAAHFSELPAQGVILVILSLTAFGAVLSILAVRTGRLGASIITHATFNLFTVFFLVAGR